MVFASITLPEEFWMEFNPSSYIILPYFPKK